MAACSPDSLEWEARSIGRYLLDVEPTPQLIERYLRANRILFPEPLPEADRATMAFVRNKQMRTLFREIARQMGKRCVAGPIPAWPLLFALQLSERMGLRLPVSSENLLGARALRVQHSATDLEKLGVRARSAEESLEQLFSRR